MHKLLTPEGTFIIDELFNFCLAEFSSVLFNRFQINVFKCWYYGVPFRMKHLTAGFEIPTKPALSAFSTKSLTWLRSCTWSVKAFSRAEQGNISIPNIGEFYPPPPGGYSQKNWVGVCCPLLKTLTLFMTKICDIPYPIYDLTKNSKRCL